MAKSREWSRSECDRSTGDQARPFRSSCQRRLPPTSVCLSEAVARRPVTRELRPHPSGDHAETRVRLAVTVCSSRCTATSDDARSWWRTNGIGSATGNASPSRNMMRSSGSASSRLPGPCDSAFQRGPASTPRPHRRSARTRGRPFEAGIQRERLRHHPVEVAALQLDPVGDVVVCASDADQGAIPLGDTVVSQVALYSPIKRTSSSFARPEPSGRRGRASGDDTVQPASGNGAQSWY